MTWLRTGLLYAESYAGCDERSGAQLRVATVAQPVDEAPDGPPNRL